MSQERAWLAVEAVTGKPAPGRLRAEQRKAEKLEAKDVAVGVACVSGGVIWFLVGGLALFSVLAAGPVGLLLIIVLVAVAGSSSSSGKRSGKFKPTGFYSPYYPKR